MKVKELIEELQKYPDDLRVLITDYETWGIDYLEDFVCVRQTLNYGDKSSKWTTVGNHYFNDNEKFRDVITGEKLPSNYVKEDVLVLDINGWQR